MIGRAVGFAVRVLVVGFIVAMIGPWLLALLPFAVLAIVLQHAGLIGPSESLNG